MARMTYEQEQSELTSDGHTPECCFADPANGPGAAAYAAYNNGGPTERRGLNYAGEPCPPWRDLPLTVQQKWNAVTRANVSAPGMGVTNITPY